MTTWRINCALGGLALSTFYGYDLLQKTKSPIPSVKLQNEILGYLIFIPSIIGLFFLLKEAILAPILFIYKRHVINKYLEDKKNKRKETKILKEARHKPNTNKRPKQQRYINHFKHVDRTPPSSDQKNSGNEEDSQISPPSEQKDTNQELKSFEQPLLENNDSDLEPQVPVPQSVEQPKVVEQPKIVEQPKVVEQPKIVEQPKVVEQQHPKNVEAPKIEVAQVPEEPLIVTSKKSTKKNKKLNSTQPVIPQSDLKHLQPAERPHPQQQKVEPVVRIPEPSQKPQEQPRPQPAVVVPQEPESEESRLKRERQERREQRKKADEQLAMQERIQKEVLEHKQWEQTREVEKQKSKTPAKEVKPKEQPQPIRQELQMISKSRQKLPNIREEDIKNWNLQEEPKEKEENWVEIEFKKIGKVPQPKVPQHATEELVPVVPKRLNPRDLLTEEDRQHLRKLDDELHQNIKKRLQEIERKSFAQTILNATQYSVRGDTSFRVEKRDIKSKDLRSQSLPKRHQEEKQQQKTYDDDLPPTISPYQLKESQQRTSHSVNPAKARNETRVKPTNPDTSAITNSTRSDIEPPRQRKQDNEQKATKTTKTTDYPMDKLLSSTPYQVKTETTISKEIQKPSTRVETKPAPKREQQRESRQQTIDVAKTSQKEPVLAEESREQAPYQARAQPQPIRQIQERTEEPKSQSKTKTSNRSRTFFQEQPKTLVNQVGTLKFGYFKDVAQWKSLPKQPKAPVRTDVSERITEKNQPLATQVYVPKKVETVLSEPKAVEESTQSSQRQIQPMKPEQKQPLDQQAREVSEYVPKKSQPSTKEVKEPVKELPFQIKQTPSNEKQHEETSQQSSQKEKQQQTKQISSKQSPYVVKQTAKPAQGLPVLSNKQIEQVKPNEDVQTEYFQQTVPVQLTEAPQTDLTNDYPQRNDDQEKKVDDEEKTIPEISIPKQIGQFAAKPESYSFKIEDINNKNGIKQLKESIQNEGITQKNIFKLVEEASKIVYPSYEKYIKEMRSKRRAIRKDDQTGYEVLAYNQVADTTVLEDLGLQIVCQEVNGEYKQIIVKLNELQSNQEQRAKLVKIRFDLEHSIQSEKEIKVVDVIAILNFIIRKVAEKKEEKVRYLKQELDDDVFERFNVEFEDLNASENTYKLTYKEIQELIIKKTQAIDSLNE